MPPYRGHSTACSSESSYVSRVDLPAMTVPAPSPVDAANESPLDIDVIIAVHSATRPVARAVRSALKTASRVRVTVVVHNIDPAVIERNLGDLVDDPRVRLIELQDGIRSPAGPMNLGLRKATADWFALLGSDDEFEAGALDAWLELAQRTAADVVIAGIQDVGRPSDPYPPKRRDRVSDLDGDRDRLVYRSAPLGLVSLRAFPGVQLAAGLPSGEDLPLVARLWMTGARVSFDPALPLYIGHVDAEDRVTAEPRPVAADFAFLDHIVGAEWWDLVGPKARRALVLKTIRIHVFDAIVARLSEGGLEPTARTAIRAVLDRLRAMSPNAFRLLSIADSKAITTALRATSTREDITRAIDARWNYGSLPTLITSNPFLSLHRHAPFRLLQAGIAVRHAITTGFAARGGPQRFMKSESSPETS